MRFGVETKLDPAEVAKRARSFFGPDGELRLPEQPGGVDSLTFGTDIGHVTIEIVPHKGHTAVTVLSREYDLQAEQFIREIA